MFFHGGGKRSEGLLLRSPPSPRAQAELKLAPGEQSARVGNMKAAGTLTWTFHCRTGPSSPRSYPTWRSVCAMWRYTVHTLVSHPCGMSANIPINHLTLHASVVLAADVSRLQQQQRLAVALLLLRLPAGARGARPEPRGCPALSL